jgi:hypothetical protein
MSCPALRVSKRPSAVWFLLPLLSAALGCADLDLDTDDPDLLAPEDLIGEEEDLTGTISFTAVADARVESNHASTNYGTQTKLYMDNNPMERSYVRFTVSNITGTISKAVVRAYATNGSRNGPAIYLTTSTWTESGLTWNNKPAPVGLALTDLGRVYGGQFVNFDVTSAVKGNGTFSFVLVGTSDDGVDLYSREGANKPALVITSTDSSECVPTTCAAQGKNCGSLSDGCGGTLSCGSCTSPQTCGGGGTANVCGSSACTPTTCATQGKNCGSISDGCGGTLSCGTCTSPETCGGAGTANVCGASVTDPSGPPAGYKIAVIGDTEAGTNFKAVLNLVKSEGASALVVAGDLGYSSSANTWFSALDGVLGSGFPVFAAEGNHDASQGWTNYSNVFVPRWQNAGATVDQRNVADGTYSITHKGLFFVMVGQNGSNSGTYASYITEKLNADNHTWRLCTWHKNQAAMQIGGKVDEMGWAVYENCRAGGAIILTGHEHSYERTKTLSSMTNQTVSSTCGSATALCVGPNRTFTVVSGLGGNSIRDQQRCLPSTPPYGCKGEWASIYSSNQGAKYGATFITFNVDGNPKKATGYFKNISGQIIDQFTILKD